MGTTCATRATISLLGDKADGDQETDGAEGQGAPRDGDARRGSPLLRHPANSLCGDKPAVSQPTEEANSPLCLTSLRKYSLIIRN